MYLVYAGNAITTSFERPEQAAGGGDLLLKISRAAPERSKVRMIPELVKDESGIDIGGTQSGQVQVAAAHPPCRGAARPRQHYLR